jgi:hypothetical protein
MENTQQAICFGQIFYSINVSISLVVSDSYNCRFCEMRLSLAVLASFGAGQMTEEKLPIYDDTSNYPQGDFGMGQLLQTTHAHHEPVELR